MPKPGPSCAVRRTGVRECGERAAAATTGQHGYSFCLRVARCNNLRSESTLEHALLQPAHGRVQAVPQRAHSAAHHGLLRGAAPAGLGARSSQASIAAAAAAAAAAAHRVPLQSSACAVPAVYSLSLPPISHSPSVQASGSAAPTPSSSSASAGRQPAAVQWRQHQRQRWQQ